MRRAPIALSYEVRSRSRCIRSPKRRRPDVPGSLLPLDTLAATIKAHIAAGDKAVGKAEEHYIAAGVHLAEAKWRVKAEGKMTWPAFLAGRCGLRRTRADELISIAEGRTTSAEVRNAIAARVREHRQQEVEKTPLRNGSFSPDLRASREAQSEYARVLNRVIQKLKRLDMEALLEVKQFIMENYDV
jgi:hypothetical protein